MLAMALFLDRYIKSSMLPTEKDKLELAWLQRWQERLGNPSRLPRKVMMTYMDSGCTGDFSKKKIFSNTFFSHCKLVDMVCRMKSHQGTFQKNSFSCAL
jgi:hypothetical protein